MSAAGESADVLSLLVHCGPKADSELSLDEGHALAQVLEDIPNDEAPPPEPEVQIRAGKVDESFRKITSDGGVGGGGGGYGAKSVVHVQLGKVAYQLSDQLLKASTLAAIHNPHLLSKDQLEKMITEKDPELEYRKHHNNNSTWQRYMPMFYKGVKQNYVRCLECGWLVLHKASTGTGSLLRHRCKIKLPSGVEVKLEPKVASGWSSGGGHGKTTAKSAAAIASVQASAPAQVLKFPPVSSILPQNVKDDLIRQQACVLYKDIVSADLFELPSFRTLAQMLVNIGVYYGQQENLLASREVLLDTILPAMYHEAKGQLNKVLADCDLTFSFGLFRNALERRSYVAINAYTVASDYYFRQINVKTLEVTGQEGAYVEHLQRIIEDSLARTFPDPIKVVFGGMPDESVGGLRDTAEQALRSRPDQYETIPCVVTMLWGIMKSVLEEFHCDGTRYFERTFYQTPDEDEGAPVPAETAALYRYLETFREPIRSLVSDTSVTISEVILWRKKLELTFRPEDTDDDEVRVVKGSFLSLLRERFHLHDYHRIAVFLDPKFKGLRFLSDEEREDTIAAVKTHLHSDIEGIERVKSQYNNGDSGGGAGGGGCANGTKKRTNASLAPTELKFYEFMDSSLKLECNDVVDDEIKQYIDVKLESAVDIMSYWRAETAFPLLKRLCRRILNIPAACDEMKLLFGQTGQRDVHKRRLMLSEREMDMVMYLHQNSP
uniref:BED-type domain-containing protein n=1 Tax=Anopheles atroparvus TaxID=41427 RepID=A0AAG5CQV8_ANOAO